MTRWFRLLLCSAALSSVAPSLALAEDDEGWSFRLTPYLWVPSLSLDATVGSNPPVNSTTSLLDILNAAALVTGEVRKGRWALTGEFNYLDLGDKGTTPGGRTTIETGLQGVMGSAAVAYRAVRFERSGIDVLAGARIWSLETTVDFSDPGQVSRDSTFVDPIIGVRAEHRFDENWSVHSLADIGGFGVGSDFQWELLGRVNYSFNQTWTVGLGYRHLALNFDRNGADVDAALSGPFVAVDIAW